MTERSIPEPSRKLNYLRFLIDTNRINAKGKLPHMNILESWKKKGVIDMDYSDTVISELKGYGPGYEKTIGNMNTISFAEDESCAKFKKIESIMFPDGAKSDNQLNDVRIVFHAYKYHYILVTNDGSSKSQPGGILGHASELKKELDIDIMRDSEAVDLVNKKLEERDEYARNYSINKAVTLLRWVGKDFS